MKKYVNSHTKYKVTKNEKEETLLELMAGHMNCNFLCPTIQVPMQESFKTSSTEVW